MTDFLSQKNISKDIKNFTIDELRSLSYEIRLKIIDSVINCGGHLASSLGAVELIVALHFVFDFPLDKLVFDVGHQAYAHKLLTNRADEFDTKLRKLDGIGAFLRRSESEYDTFTTGHAGVSISQAIGLARARDAKGENYNVISVVGDSSITNGISFEAMNDNGSRSSRHIVVLNDNNMSISRAVGAISSKLTYLRQSTYYKRLKRVVIKSSNSKNGGSLNFKALKKFKNGVKYMFTKGVIFEEFGYKYIGPIDGHDIEELIRSLNIAKNETEPVLLHVVTQKGKGCIEAEREPELYHGTGDLYSIKPQISTYSDVFGEKIYDFATKNKDVVAISAATSYGSGLKKFANDYKDRFFDVGIAEEHAVALASGLARGGMKPYVSIYSTFLQRSIDQVIHDVALQDLPITICVDRAGIVGEDGETHQGIFDLSFLTTIPELAVLAPSSINEFEQILDFSLNYNKPLVVRYPRGCVDNEVVNKFCFGKWILDNESMPDVLLIASGAVMVREGLDCVQKLKEYGISATLVNASTVKPIDKEFLDKFISVPMVVLEDNVRHGGLCGLIMEYYAALGKNHKILSIAIEDCFVKQGKIDELQDYYGIKSSKFIQKVYNFIKNFKND